MKQKLLTISLPTWNRCKLVKELLDDLIAQITSYNLQDDIEILVSNNGSEDSTHEVVQELMKKYDFITYNRNATNIGGTPNVILSWQLANSEYLIFLGDDDRINNGSLKRIIDFLKSNRNIGVLLDSHSFKKRGDENTDWNITNILKNYYWNIGNAGVFIIKSSYVKEGINKHGIQFFNQGWPQTQMMTLGLQDHKSDKVFLSDLNVISHSIHGEVTVYNSYYLWITTVYELLRSMKDLEPFIDQETYLAARQYLRNNVVQLLFNFLQCGVFIDDAATRKKTRDHIIKHINIFSPYERKFFWIGVVTLSMPTFLSRFSCNIFILLLKGKAGIKKKNEFVETERRKMEIIKKSKSISVRELDLEG